MKKTLTLTLLLFPLILSAQTNNPIIIVDGVILDNSETIKPDSWHNALDPSEIEKVTVLKGQDAVDTYGEFLGENGLVLITRKSPNSKNIPEEAIMKYGDEKPVIVIDDKVADEEEMKSLLPNQIEKIDVFKKVANYVKEYGPQALNGVVKITMKK